MVSLKFILGFLIFILVVHAIATINYWYWTFRWLDTPMHFLGGFWVAMAFFYFIRPKLEIINCQLLITILLSVAFVALIGVFWEIFEFLLGLFVLKTGYLSFLKMPQGAAINVYDIYKDTLGDLFFGLAGGLGAAFIFQLRKNKGYSLE